MSYKICPVCIKYMTGIVTQPFDPATENPQITEFVCPYCNYEETETIPAPPSLGTFNSGVGRLMDPILPTESSWGIYNSGVGYKIEPVPDPLKV